MSQRSSVIHQPFVGLVLPFFSEGEQNESSQKKKKSQIELDYINALFNNFHISTG